MLQCHLMLFHNVVDYNREQKEKQIIFKKMKNFPVQFRRKCQIRDINYGGHENVFSKNNHVIYDKFLDKLFWNKVLVKFNEG